MSDSSALTFTAFGIQKLPDSWIGRSASWSYQALPTGFAAAAGAAGAAGAGAAAAGAGVGSAAGCAVAEPAGAAVGAAAGAAAGAAGAAAEPAGCAAGWACAAPAIHSATISSARFMTQLRADAAS